MPSHEEEDKPCRACNDFKTWSKKQSKTKKETPAPPTNAPAPEPEKRKDCPLDKDELGTSTWGFLHSMASYYPEKPTTSQAKDMDKFFTLFGEFYPCEPCAIDFREDIKAHPPKTKTRDELAKWLCERHNTVNKKLGKPVFDCSKVHERWRDGWPDGSCD
ncbi:PREDICTED: FAD-linked sulfhydryl oxidase ALR [Papilio xuthus]|uniref:Sulfhydryl oxidase n=1 Tax=Papilio xuthus TaxID=66420 RepID=A0A194Q9T1_PAPXU|nr:PREDICTED: FAD-linked sulfhydryl oxidase ALR [Papilio xuthus]KPJ02174.1 FAD-linked sulfhydryl oxidase ALR [Papilio xuthus]